MSTVKLEAFLNDVMPEVPGCDTPIALHAIRSAAIEFCNRSLAVRVDIDQGSTEAGERVYDLEPPTNSVLITKVLSLRVDGEPVSSKTEDELDEWDKDWQTKTGSVSHFTQHDIYQLIFAYVPDAVYTVDMTVATTPKPDATVVDRILYDKFREGVAHGAKYRLKVMPKKPWSDPTGALFYKNQFNQAIGSASVVAEKGFGRAPLRAKACV